MVAFSLNGIWCWTKLNMKSVAEITSSTSCNDDIKTKDFCGFWLAVVDADDEISESGNGN